MHVIDRSRLLDAIQKSGFDSVDSFARMLGLHRNTVNYYLSGSGVFPKAVEKMLVALKKEPQELLVNKSTFRGVDHEALVAGLVDELRRKSADVTFVLFGSRARGTHKNYSDIDIGCFKQSNMEHSEFRKMLVLAKELAEPLPVAVDLVNLNAAGPGFLKNAAKDWKFLTGSMQGWLALKERMKNG